MEIKIKEMIEKNPLALSTTNKEGKPHVIAVTDVKLIDENQLLIGNNFMKKTIDNIKNNPNVSLAVWDNKKGSKAEGYGIDGIAEYYEKGKFLDMIKKIHQGCPARGAIVVNIKKISKLLG